MLRWFGRGRRGAAIRRRHTIEILRAEPRDLRSIELLLEEIDREESPSRFGSATQGLRRSVGAFDLFASSSAWLLCARRGGGLVGYALVVRIPKLDARLGHLFIDELHVLRGHRRHGVATALLEAVWALCAQLGYHGVRLFVRPENLAARQLYARLGFTEHQSGFCERVR